MSDNPYESPKTESAPPGLRKVRNRRWTWLKDRMALIGTALGVTAVIFGVVFGVIALGWPMRYAAWILCGIFVGVNVTVLVMSRR